MATLNLGDIQGIVARGYGELEGGCYMLLGIRDAAAARAWLGGLTSNVTSAAVRPEARALNVAFTHGGLRALGLDEDTLSTFPHEFEDGMTSSYRRRILGDSGDSAPERWDWGGPNTGPVHILILLFGRDEEARAEFCREVS